MDGSGLPEPPRAAPWDRSERRRIAESIVSLVLEIERVRGEAQGGEETEAQYLRLQELQLRLALLQFALYIEEAVDRPPRS